MKEVLVERALVSVGLALVELDRADEALAAFRQALDLECAAGNRYGEGATFHDLGWALLSLDRGHEALTAYQQARQRYREAGDRAREAAVLRGIGRGPDETGPQRRGGHGLWTGPRPDAGGG